ncbi:muts domain V-domain-containing protein [Absidia repens]|uniref:DNA mismatch repair protein MSH3 n=1 Tax=Absidia repens TaxID=90262 RepID=A0A1X2IXH1_9FUNG|nr:muts domain V-domain-containing protein [Absidia repens]
MGKIDLTPQSKLTNTLSENTLAAVPYNVRNILLSPASPQGRANSDTIPLFAISDSSSTTSTHKKTNVTPSILNISKSAVGPSQASLTSQTPHSQYMDETRSTTSHLVAASSGYKRQKPMDPSGSPPQSQRTALPFGKSQTKPTSSQRAPPRTSLITQNATIMAITEGCGVATEVGICYIHLPSSECTMAQISDLQTFSKTMLKIYLANPAKILVTASPTTSPMTKLMQLVEKHFPRIELMSLPRREFNDEEGLQFIKKFGIEESVTSLLRVISAKYYCLAATSALFKYLEGRDGRAFCEHTLKFVYDTVEGTMMIDAISAKNLELINNLSKANNKETLFGTMNHTTTPMGARLLRTTILQPCTDTDIINARLDAVEELLKKESEFFSLKSSLKHLMDLDHVISTITKMPRFPRDLSSRQMASIHAAESHINHIIALKNALKTILQVSQTLESYNDDPLLQKIGQIMAHEDLGKYRQLIQETINEDIGYEKTSLGTRNQRCYAIKAGVNGLLDVARQTYKEVIEDIYDTATEYCDTFELSLKLQFDNERKFYLTLPADQSDMSLPSIFINVSKKKKIITFTSLELLQKNSRVEEALTEIYMMSDRSVGEILQRFQSGIHIFYKVSESISLLDLLLSFATGCTLSERTRPEFTGTLAIKSGRHPVLDSIATVDTIPNDTFASLSSTFQFVTGPNMSGKSTYIKQIALLTIMAQTGSFVPAEYASFKIVNQILTRLANDTNFSTSYFMAEMQEMAYILQHVTNSSLVIIDELGRGASRLDSLSIATAISEELIQSKAQCFFATHLIEMASNLEMHPSVVNLQLSIETHLVSSTISFPYTVKDGISTTRHYGILAAQYMGLPKSILDYATSVAEKLDQIDASKTDDSKTTDSHRYKMLNWVKDIKKKRKK